MKYVWTIKMVNGAMYKVLTPFSKITDMVDAVFGRYNGKTVSSFDIANPDEAKIKGVILNSENVCSIEY